MLQENSLGKWRRMVGGGVHSIAAESFSKALFKLSNFFIVFYQIDWLCASVNKFQLPSVSYTHTFGKIFANTLHRFPRICSGDLLTLALFLWLLFAVQRITKLGHSQCRRLRVCLHVIMFTILGVGRFCHGLRLILHLLYTVQKLQPFKFC